MDSQTSADDNDIINQYVNNFNRCSCGTLSDTTLGLSNGCRAKDFFDKLKKLLQKARATVEEAHCTKSELAIAQKTLGDLKMAFWKCFPSPHFYYYIQVPLGSGEDGGYLYAHNSGLLFARSGGHNNIEYFKLAKVSDGAYSIYSMSTGKYLQIQTSSSVMFCANNVDNMAKFGVIYHPHQDKQLPGILVDIYSLANGRFLSVEVNRHNQNCIVAKSSSAPANKFLILTGSVE